MTAILGVTDGDNAGAALLVNGRLVAAVNEERLNRMKMSVGFPRLAIPEVLRLGGIEAKDIDCVAMAAFAEHHHPQARPNKGWFHQSSSMGRIRNEIAGAVARRIGAFPPALAAYRYLKRASMGRRRGGVRRLLGELGIHAPTRYYEHHTCHAIAAYATSGFENALSLSLDGGGDGCCSHVYDVTEGRDELVHKLDSMHSIGNYYAYVTHLCGFRAAIHEGKITGLAASGEPRFKEMFEKLIAYEDGEIRNRGRLYYSTAISALREMLPSDWEHRDLASSIQQHLEEVVVNYVQFWMRRTGKRLICLSGGVFANVRLNQKIAELPECDGVFVFPAMGDGGLAAGSAIAEWRTRENGGVPETGRMDHAYLGPSFDEEEIRRELERSGTAFTRHEVVEAEIARLLAAGRVVARFDGAMEFGPRALGNRTILYRPDDPTVNDWLNKHLNRTEFMPFAPACRAGTEEKLFDWSPAFARAARFMTITLDCTPWMREKCPAVVHVDGTARPQIVDEENNPSFHRTIVEYEKLTGVPVVINTSFNMHEEPIVCTPADAVRAYKAGKLDHLAIGPFVLGDSSKPTARES